MSVKAVQRNQKNAAKKAQNVEFFKTTLRAARPATCDLHVIGKVVCLPYVGTGKCQVFEELFFIG